jgi:hypothetical protein
VLAEQGRSGTADVVAIRLSETARRLTRDADDLLRRAVLIRRADGLVGVTSVPGPVAAGARREAEYALAAPFGPSDWEAAFRRWCDGPTAAVLHGRSPAVVAAMFSATSPRSHLEIARTEPESIGALDGAPPNLRYAANRILLRREIGRLEAEVAAVDARLASQSSSVRPRYVGTELRRDVLRRRRHDLATALLRYRAWAAEGRQILLFDPAGDGRVAEVFGDLEAAEHVAVVVPGAATDLDGFGPAGGPGFRDDGRALFRAASELDSPVATIAWLGYDPPDGIDAVSRSAADVAHHDLVRFVDGLVASGDRHITVIGHSYGSLVTGLAAGLGIAADEIVFVGSPGTSLDHAGDANLPPGGQVWAGLASWDLIGAGARPTGDGWLESSMSLPARYVWDLVATGDPAVEDLWHGTNPVHESFGAAEFSTDGATGHSQYFDPGTDSLENLARIVVGIAPRAVAPASRPRRFALGRPGEDPIAAVNRVIAVRRREPAIEDYSTTIDSNTDA